MSSPATDIDPRFASKAPILEGFRFVGADQDADYCEIAARRMAQAVLPLDIEPPTPRLKSDAGPLFGATT